MFRLIIILISLLTCNAFASVKNELATLERSAHVKIGVYAIDTNSQKIISYHSESLFPFQSTFKIIAAAKLLKNSERNNKLLDKAIHYSKKDLAFWTPVTSEHLQQGMTLKALTEAAVTYSDNTAINLVMNNIGGPKAVNTFAHSTGNHHFNLKHYEPHLNSNPKNINDTSTPKDMALSVKSILLEHTLQKSSRTELLTWMRNSTTGYHRIRAGVPAGWAVADKTGSGSYGVANDIGMVWSSACKPIILAIYTVGKKPSAKWNNHVMANATKIILSDYSKVDNCFAATHLG